MIAWACIITATLILGAASVWMATHNDWWETRR